MRLAPRWVSVLLVGTGLTTSCHRESAPAAGALNASVPAVTVATPIPRRIAEYDVYTGRLAAPQTVEVRPRVSGHLDRVHFTEGSLVKAGDLLFSIDPRPYQAVADRAAAELSRARHHAELAAAEADRATSLFKTRAISTDDRDQRVQSAAEAADAVRAAEAALAAAKLDLEFTEIRAPIAGRTSIARVTAGNLVSGGGASSTLLTTVVSLDPVYCYLEVDERSALRYRALQAQGRRQSDQAGSITAWMGLADEEGFPRQGRLDFADNQLTPETGSLRIRAVFPNPDGAAPPGFFARVRIPGTGDYDALLIRDAAIGNDQGHPFVLVVDDSSVAAHRPVELGPLIDGLRAVRSGLRPQDKVIITGLMNVRPGTRVQPTVETMVPPATNASPAVAAGTAGPKPGTNSAAGHP